MHNPLLLKLDRLCGLGPSDIGGLDFGESSFASAREEIFRDGQVVSHAKLVLTGIACHYKLMQDGRRAVTCFLLPGDFTNHQVPERQTLNFSVGALTPCRFVDVPLAAWRTSGNGRLTQALSLCMMVDIAIQRAWLANISQQPADRRLAHLLCELRHRLALVGMADECSFHLPLTQQDLADALGLSVVHVNRVLQYIKELGLIRVKDRTILIGDLGLLEEFADFDPAYLHPQGVPLPARTGDLAGVSLRAPAPSAPG
ncbi:MAG TPA: Crp/Fnr family transcriptional regulator [Rhizomicrobium sp.]|nr:Crp/Fnr family transcriptional regulator [Rhizomicrobium sp.]